MSYMTEIRHLECYANLRESLGILDLTAFVFLPLDMEGDLELQTPKIVRSRSAAPRQTHPLINRYHQQCCCNVAWHVIWTRKKWIEFY